MKDVRGSFMALPSSGGERLSDLKEFKLRRTHVHLGISRTDVSSVDNRDQSNAIIAAGGAQSGGTRSQPNVVSPEGDDPPCDQTPRIVNVRTRVGGKMNRPERGRGVAVIDAAVLQKIAKGNNRGSAKGWDPARSTKYIANHHFHPAVLQAILEQGQSDCVSVELVKGHDLVGSGYTQADLFSGTLPAGVEGPVYVPTPSYKQAKGDYKMVSTRWRLNKMISGCRAKSRGGNCTLAPRGEDNILQPVEKRGRINGVLPALDPESKEDLQRAICMLADERDEAYAEINRLKDEIKLRDSLWRGGDARLEQFAKEEMGGLCRLNISSDIYHRNHRNVAKALFAFEDRRDVPKEKRLSGWDITKSYIKIFFDADHVEPTLSHIFDAGGRRKKMSRFEEVLITLMWFQNLHDHAYIAAIFRCHRNVVSQIIQRWAPHFHEVGCQLARLPLTNEFLLKAYPQSYIDLDFSSYVASVCDGTDVLCQSVRVDRAINVLQRSDKVKASAFRGVT